MVEGSDPTLKSEAVVFTAHWDHLGVGRAVLGDAIYNGAADNATGCALLLELARAWAAQSPKPKRSAIFLAVTAEEKGLLGSKYYAAAPARPAGQDGAQPQLRHDPAARRAGVGRRHRGGADDRVADGQGGGGEEPPGNRGRPAGAPRHLLPLGPLLDGPGGRPGVLGRGRA